MKNLFPILDSLSLSETEQGLVDRFKERLEGPLYVAKILAKHGLVRESCELLAWGVRANPQNTALRVAYAEQLFRRGLIQDCWDALQRDKSSLRDNLRAKHLRLQSAVLLDMECQAEEIASSLTHLDQHSPHTKSIAQRLTEHGLVPCRRFLIEELVRQGVSPILASANSKAAASRPTHQPDADETASFAGFQVIPLTEVLKPTRLNDGGPLLEEGSHGIAQVYEQQQNFQQALATYRKLLREAPGDNYLRSKVRELALKLSEQTQTDLRVDPEIADRMESIDKIDQKIEYLQTLLKAI